MIESLRLVSTEHGHKINILTQDINPNTRAQINLMTQNSDTSKWPFDRQ